jgi:hypothetical protein
MDPKGKGMVVNDKEKESFLNEPRDDKPTDSGSRRSSTTTAMNLLLHQETTTMMILLQRKRRLIKITLLTILA